MGKSHNLSAALLTGGKKEFREEQRRIGRMNIVVATPVSKLVVAPALVQCFRLTGWMVVWVLCPWANQHPQGRLLQHLQETPGFDPSQLQVGAPSTPARLRADSHTADWPCWWVSPVLQVLVLDEADRILDLGFSQQLNSILTYLPSDGRQTLLFSATQTKSVKDLARLSLQQPEYVGVHDKDETATPSQLVQNYIVTELPDKLDMLWSFIRVSSTHDGGALRRQVLTLGLLSLVCVLRCQTHIRHKIIVFFSSCSQVRFVYECFRCMQPGTPLLALHGKIKQMRCAPVGKQQHRPTNTPSWQRTGLTRASLACLPWHLWQAHAHLLRLRAPPVGRAVRHGHRGPRPRLPRVRLGRAGTTHHPPPTARRETLHQRRLTWGRGWCRSACLACAAGGCSGGRCHVHPPRGPHGQVPGEPTHTHTRQQAWNS